MDKKGRMIQQGRFQKNTHWYRGKPRDVLGFGKSEMRMFQEVKRNQHSICSQEIPNDLSESSVGEMMGVEARPKRFEE